MEESSLEKAQNKVKYWEDEIFRASNANEFYSLSGEMNTHQHELDFWRRQVEEIKKNIEKTKSYLETEEAFEHFVGHSDENLKIDFKLVHTDKEYTENSCIYTIIILADGNYYRMMYSREQSEFDTYEAPEFYSWNVERVVPEEITTIIWRNADE